MPKETRSSSVRGRVRKDGTPIEPAAKRSRVQLDVLGIRAAQLHYARGLPHEEVLQVMRTEGHPVRSARDVSVLINQARSRGVIQLSLRVYGPTAAVDPELSRRLADKANLPDAVVAATGKLGSDKHERSVKASDEIHSILGRLAVRPFLRALRPGDRVGVGSGRGVGFTIDTIRLEQPILESYSNCQVLSLVGGMTRVPWSGSPENLDADNNAGKLGATLGGANVNWANVTTVQLPTFLSSERDRIVRAEAPHLMGNPSGPPFLDVCLLGLGVLSSEHHLLRGSEPQPRAVHSELAGLRDEVIPYCPAPVIDVCERFWPGQVDDERRSRVEELVGRLNDRVVSAPAEELSRVRERIFVAGTAQKYQAVKACLIAPGVVRPTVLVTDEATARRLLKEL